MIKKVLKRIKKDKRYSYTYKGNESKYDELKLQKKLIICVNVGRSGTRWLADIFDAHNGVVGTCERLTSYESFYRYVKWYGLNIDLSGVINTLKDSIIQDWETNDTSMIVSPYLSHDLEYINKELKPDAIIWGVTDPMFTVNSFNNKWQYTPQESFKIPGLDPNKSINQSFGRIIPNNEEEFLAWNKLSNIGKISWLYSKVNNEIYDALQNIDTKQYIFKLEKADQNYQFYLDLADCFNLTPLLSQKKFLSIKGKTVKKSDNVKKELTRQEELEFHQYTDEFYEKYLKLVTNY